MSEYWVTVTETGIVSEACFDPKISNYLAFLLRLLIDDDNDDDGDDDDNKGIGDAGSTADIRMLWPLSALVCLGLL